MNYKRLIPSRKLRLAILRLFDFVPDRIMISVQFYLSKGFFPDLRSPERFTEKLQWYKLYYRTDLLTQCSDKLAVRDYVVSKGLNNILIPLHAVYDHAEQINFSLLPDQFVLKTNNGSHTNIICRNKDELDQNEAKQKLSEWLRVWRGKVGREWSYYHIKPKVLCEQYLPKDKNGDLIDYKFLCFNGKVFCLYVVVGRFLSDGIGLGIYDVDFTKLPYHRSDIKDIEQLPDKPENFAQMVEIAEILAQGFPHVRVDLYNIDGAIYFGELTFYDGSGYKGYIPDEFDAILGSQFILPEK